VINLGPLKRHYTQLRSDIKRVPLKQIFTFSAALPGFFRERISLPCAKEQIKQMLETREEAFLALATARIYEDPASPYLPLLKHAGCELSDLRTQVCRYGLEKTLEQLAREGVYFSSDEVKGKMPVVRGNLSFRVSPTQFTRQDSTSGYAIQSSGTRKEPIRSIISLDWLAVRTPVVGVFFGARHLFLMPTLFTMEFSQQWRRQHAADLCKIGSRHRSLVCAHHPVDSWLENNTTIC
jgi:hypothetical protein